MKTLVIFLVLIAFSALSLAILVLLGCPIINIQNISALPAIAISCGVLIASLTYLRDTGLKQDEVHLAVAKEGFDEVYDLLSDLDNSRVVWIRAARVLLGSLDLKKNIKNKHYVKVFEVSEENLRSKLYRLLQIEPDDPSESGNQSLPPQFFYGIENWKDKNISLDEAAIQSKSKIKAYSVSIDKVTPEPKSADLDAQSVVAIYDFISNYPKNYNDPLKRIKTWCGDSHDKSGIEQGPAKYVEHKNKFYVIDGKLHRYEKKT